MQLSLPVCVLTQDLPVTVGHIVLTEGHGGKNIKLLNVFKGDKKHTFDRFALFNSVWHFVCVCVTNEVEYILMCLLAIWIFSVQVKAYFCIVCPFLIDLHDSLHSLHCRFFTNLFPGFWLVFCITNIFLLTMGCNFTPKWCPLKHSFLIL